MVLGDSDVTSRARARTTRPCTSGSCMLSTGRKSGAYGSGVNSERSAATPLLHAAGVAAYTSSGLPSKTTSHRGQSDFSWPWNGSHTSTSLNTPTVGRAEVSSAPSPVAENGALGARISCSIPELPLRSRDPRVRRGDRDCAAALVPWSGTQSSAGMAAVMC